MHRVMKCLYKYALICIILLTASCGRDVIYELPDGDKYSHLYMPQAVDSPASKRLFMLEDVQTLHYSAFYSGYSAPNDINIRFEVRPELVQKFNEDNSTEYDFLPEGAWELEADQAFIPAGGCTTELMDINITTFGHIRPFKEYMLPVVMLTDDVKVSEQLSTLYYVISAAYEPGNVPSMLVSEDKKNAIVDAIEIFSFNDNCLIARSADGKVRRYAYDTQTGKFLSPTILQTDWVTSQVKLLAKGPGNAVNVCNLYDTWITYEWGSDAATIPAYANYKSVITGGTYIFKSLVTNCPTGLLAVLSADNSLLWYKMSNDGHSYVSVYAETKGFNFGLYKHLFYYGNDLIGIDAAGDMWLHNVKSDNTFSVSPTQVGSGWDDFTHVIPFGTDILVRTADGRLYKYQFDLKGFWALKK